MTRYIVGWWSAVVNVNVEELTQLALTILVRLSALHRSPGRGGGGLLLALEADASATSGAAVSGGAALQKGRGLRSLGDADDP